MSAERRHCGSWKGWADFRNLTTHQYWRADATIAAEAMERAIPLPRLETGRSPAWHWVNERRTADVAAVHDA